MARTDAKKLGGRNGSGMAVPGDRNMLGLSHQLPRFEKKPERAHFSSKLTAYVPIPPKSSRISMPNSPDTARRSTAVALNNMAIDLLRCSAWNEAASVLRTAVDLIGYSVSDGVDDVINKDQHDFNALLRATEDQVQHFRSLDPIHQPRAACAPRRENLCPVLINSEADEIPINTDTSMIIYNYALALDCAGAPEEDSVYRLLQMSSSLLPQDQIHAYQVYQLELTQQLLDTAQRLGLEEDCIQHKATVDSLVQLAREYNQLLQTPSASAA